MEASLQLARSDYEAMLAHLREVYPLEGCGLLAGNGGMVARLYPVANMLASPYQFEMEPRQQLQALIDLEESGWELLAIYHSHPDGPETPSSTDVARAYYPEAIQIVVSLRDRSHPSVRAFTIVAGKVDEVELRIV